MCENLAGLAKGRFPLCGPARFSPGLTAHKAGIDLSGPATLPITGAAEA